MEKKVVITTRPNGKPVTEILSVEQANEKIEIYKKLNTYFVAVALA